MPTVILTASYASKPARVSKPEMRSGAAHTLPASEAVELQLVFRTISQARLRVLSNFRTDQKPIVSRLHKVQREACFYVRGMLPPLRFQLEYLGHK